MYIGMYVCANHYQMVSVSSLVVNDCPHSRRQWSHHYVLLQIVFLQYASLRLACPLHLLAYSIHRMTQASRLEHPRALGSCVHIQSATTLVCTMKPVVNAPT